MPQRGRLDDAGRAGGSQRGSETGAVSNRHDDADVDFDQDLMTRNEPNSPRESSPQRRGRSRKKRSSGGSRRGRGRSKPKKSSLDDTAAREAIKTPLDQGPFIVFDIETTGGNPQKNGITEIYAIKYVNGEVEDTFYSLVNPGCSIPPIVRRMTGINNKMVRKAPPIHEVMPSFLEFIGANILVSHNTIGDMKFLRHYAQEVCDRDIGNFFLCTHLLVEKLVPEAPDKSLQGLARHFELATGDLHRAEADAYATLELFKVLVERLDSHSIKYAEEAVRLQGDTESGMRLGWGIPEAALEKIPSGPGVFYLYDHERKLIFLSSAVNLQKEINKLRSFVQLPRPLLRVILRAYDIQIQRSANPYAAMLAECEALERHSIPYNPAQWHQRSIQAVSFKEERGQLKANVGSIDAGTKHAYGPVRDRRVALELLNRIAVAFNSKATKKGAVLPGEAEPIVTAFFDGTLGDSYREILKSRRSLSALLRPSHRRELGRKARIMKTLLNLEKPFATEPLLAKSGVLVVPGKGTGTWDVHTIAGSRPRNVTSIKGAPEKTLGRAGYGRRLMEQILREEDRLTVGPLTTHDVAKANATLWWIYSNRSDGQFIPIEELDEDPDSVPTAEPTTHTTQT